MKILSLDIGKRRTGIAFFDDATGVPLPLDTIRHTSVDALVSNVLEVAEKRGVRQIVAGLPLLPSGIEGEQAVYVRSVAERLMKSGIDVQFQDERYTTQRQRSQDKESHELAKNTDGDAVAACEILRSFLRC